MRPLRVGADFDGPAYQRDADHARLTGQLLRVWETMIDHRWRTLQDLADLTGDPPASVSAQLRHLRKAKFGSYIVERRAKGERHRGLYEYRLLPPGDPQ